jgi:antitoxin ParD1/3/4
MTFARRAGECFAMLATRSARLMRRNDYGISSGTPPTSWRSDCADARARRYGRNGATTTRRRTPMCSGPRSSHFCKIDNYYPPCYVRPVEDFAMPSSVDLGHQLEKFVDKLVKSGRYNSRSEILREGVRLVQEREARLAALDAAIARGIADAEAGRVKPLAKVFDRLEAKYRRSATKGR